MTARRAALVAALVALLVYLPALGNRFALDDGPIVERNAAAHSVGAALGAFDKTYWPPEHGAGLWRPLVILSFAADWQLSGGSTTWLHAGNVLLHALATALIVLVIAPYVTVAGALAGGVVFAVHPLHVEAVANLVGRAELLVACFLMLALLCGRAVRARRAAGRSLLPAEAGLLIATLLALLSKEHAVIAIALLWLDERALHAEPARLPLRDYAAIGVMTVLWLIARRQIDAGLSFLAIAPTFFHLGTVGRISTMLPAVLDVVRLLVFPFDLSPDYHPLVIERLEHPTAAGAIGLTLLIAIVALAALLWRRHRAASFALLMVGLAWLPTSNLLFPAGIVLAERTLYLPSVGIALLAALAADAVARRAGTRPAIAVTALICATFAFRAFTRVPVWGSTRDLVVAALIEHPESYKVHQSAARVYWRLGMRPQAMAQYGVAAEIYPLDHYLLAEIGSAALESGDLRQAYRELRAAERLDTTYTMTQQLLAQFYLRVDSAPAALRHARRAMAIDATRAESARMLAASFVALGQRDSALAVWPAYAGGGGNAFDRWLLGAVTQASLGFLDSARVSLDSATARVSADTIAGRRLVEARAEVARLSRPSR